MGKATILVVEDEAEIGEVFRLNLEGAGFRVLWATDGLEALRLCDEERPDLATVDLMVPIISGYRLVELLKGRRPPGPLPVIVVTALDFEEADDVARLGADGFLMKPIRADELVSMIEYILARRARCEGGVSISQTGSTGSVPAARLPSGSTRERVTWPARSLGGASPTST